MAGKPVKYCLVDAFTESAFKRNPAAVCLLEDTKLEDWLQVVASEFNLSVTCYMTRIVDSASEEFQLRWFTPKAEGGYKGFYSQNTIKLTTKLFSDIHKRSGMFLQTSRGGYDTKNRKVLYRGSGGEL